MPRHCHRDTCTLAKDRQTDRDGEREREKNEKEKKKAPAEQATCDFSLPFYSGHSTVFLKTVHVSVCF